MTRFVALLLSLIVAVRSDFLNNELTALGNDPQSFDGLSPSNFRAYTDRDNIVEDIHLRYYKGKTLDDYVDIKLPNSEELLKQKNFKKDNPTMLYAHGYKEIPERESVQTVISAYLANQPDTNIILIDWSNMAQGSYIINAAPNTRKVGYAVADELVKLIRKGLALEKIHLVGHSLGGQVVGFIGKETQKFNVKLTRISALDPAFPMFYPGYILNHISADDAVFVDVIHTDAGLLGAPVATGSVDFWPNDGVRPQPGCPKGIHPPLSPDDTCSHWRSWRYWSESLHNPKSFVAKQMDNGKTIINYMGIAAEPSLSGDFYLKTHDVPPFGMGN